ncbi:cullin-3 [[Candida] railenensis]|uniref:Cullin-3 n=1 Tax=[Candida] railenensis TaxID=45579 RepID=A0A9P0VXP6_9ASCO|nr:cullin-3 [[Candida] railenensis]
MLPPGSRRSKIRPPRNSLLSSFVGGSASSSSGSSSTANAGAEDYEKSWAILSSAIIQIQNKNVSNLSYEQLYRKAYILVLRKQGSRLYENVTQLIVKHLLERREALLAKLSKESGGEFLKTLLSEWTEHLQSMKFISDVLMYLNRVYVKERKKLLIYDLGIQLYKENLIKYNNNEVGEKLIDIIIEEVTKSRLGEVITTKMYIVKVINMMELLEETSPSSSSMISEVDLGGSEGENYYQRFFEPRFLASSETFFYQLSHQFMSENISGSAYLHEISQFIKDEEENRARYYLPMSTFPKLIDLMNNILIKDKIDEVILLPMDRQGLSFWMEGVVRGVFESQNNPAPTSTNSTRAIESFANVKELAILYELVGRIDSERELLKVRLKELVISQGQSLPTLVREKLENNSDELGVGNNSKKTPAFSYSSTSFAIEWINTISEYQEQLSTISRIAFNNDPGVVQAITVAIRDFINNSTSTNNKKSGKNSPLTASASELLSIFMDNYIKQFTKQSPSKSSSINEEFSIDQVINRSITFLRFIKDKDTFEAHYANHFAKRFLNTKAQSSLTTTTTSAAALKSNNKSDRHSTSIDLEELILSKLMEEMGSSSLEKVMKMNRDIKSSRDLTNDWKRHIKSNDVQYSSSNLVELELKICNVTDWPKSMTKDYKKYSDDNTGGTSGFPWPKQLRGTLSEFEDYWLTGKKNDNKSLHWSPKFGSMDLRITYPSPMKTYEINLSTYAGIIMLLFAPQSTDNITGELVSAFSEMRELKYEEIRELTKIPEQDLKRQLQSIAVAPRSRLLVKVPMTKEVNEGDIFKLNEKFKSPTIKVKVLTVSATSSSSKRPTVANVGGEGLPLRKTEAQEEAEEVAANIVEGRNVEINAAIVRIMKSRQTLNHNDLISELIRQLQNRFLPSTIQIKQRIEDLIEKEYLKRDSVEKSKYHYVA